MAFFPERLLKNCPMIGYAPCAEWVKTSSRWCLNHSTPLFSLCRLSVIPLMPRLYLRPAARLKTRRHLGKTRRHLGKTRRHLNFPRCLLVFGGYPAQPLPFEPAACRLPRAAGNLLVQLSAAFFFWVNPSAATRQIMPENAKKSDERASFIHLESENKWHFHNKDVTLHTHIAIK